MTKRNRPHELKIYLNDDELLILKTKMEKAGITSKSYYIRTLILYGLVYQVDMSYLRDYETSISKIGVLINQIAYKANSTNSIYAEDVNRLKEYMTKIWQLQTSMLLQKPSLNQ